MVLSTVIARFPDGLPLAASVDEAEVDSQIAEAKQQTKIIFKRLNEKSERACTIETKGYNIHYLISSQEIYLTITQSSYPRKLAFSYLDELSKEFQRSYESQVASVMRPYAFRGFDTFISKTTRLYLDSRTAESASSLPSSTGPSSSSATTSAGAGGGDKQNGEKNNMDKLNEDLQDVTRIMTKNMEDLLWRGDSLDRMSHLSTSLRSESAKYRKAARNINLEALIRKWAPVAGIGFFFLLFIWFRFIR